MIEKGKGPIVGKLRTIQLIEVDLQLLMRILVNNRNKFKIEIYHRIVKSNYGSRLDYSIDDTILDKRLVFDNSIIIGKYNTYNMTDLQLCYDRQLAEIGLIVQDSVEG